MVLTRSGLAVCAFFFRYFAHLRRLLRRLGCGNVHEYVPLRFQACRHASAINYRKNGFFIVACLFALQIRQAVALLPAGRQAAIRATLRGYVLASLRAYAALLIRIRCFIAQKTKNIKKFKKYRHIFFFAPSLNMQGACGVCRSVCR